MDARSIINQTIEKILQNPKYKKKADFLEDKNCTNFSEILEKSLPLYEKTKKELLRDLTQIIFHEGSVNRIQIVFSETPLVSFPFLMIDLSGLVQKGDEININEAEVCSFSVSELREIGPFSSPLEFTVVFRFKKITD